MESKSCILSRRGSVVTVLLETQAHVCRLNKGWQLRSRELLFSKRGERCLFFLKLKPGCYLKVSLPPVPLFTLKEIPDVFVSSEETIHKCFFPVSHLKFKKKKKMSQRKPLAPGLILCPFLPLAQRHWVKAERFSFAGNVTTKSRLSTVLSASRQQPPVGFFPPPWAL